MIITHQNLSQKKKLKSLVSSLKADGVLLRGDFMNDTNMLIGSLSNDLFRVASLAQRGSMKAATRFLEEAKRWAIPLQSGAVSPYIKNIAEDISNRKIGDISIDSAEKYLMYGVLLQNYSLHIK